MRGGVGGRSCEAEAPLDDVLGDGGQWPAMAERVRPQVEECFSGAWVQVVPSRWREPFGNVAAEAMMRGTAVIATLGGGLSEIVRDERTGILVPPNNVDALASALLGLLSDRRRAECLGGGGREFALSHLTEEIFVDRFVAL